MNKVPNSLNIEMECLRNIENSDIITANNDWVTFCYDQVLQEVCSFNLLLISHIKVKQVKVTLKSIYQSFSIKQSAARRKEKKGGGG